MLSSQQWCLGSDIGALIISWLSLLLVLVLTIRDFVFVLWLSALLKNQHYKFLSNLDAQTHHNEFIRAFPYLVEKLKDVSLR